MKAVTLVQELVKIVTIYKDGMQAIIDLVRVYERQLPVEFIRAFTAIAGNIMKDIDETGFLDE